MSIANPLADSASTDPEDRILVARARSGDRAGLEVREVVPTALETIKTLDERCAAVYREHPFLEAPDLTSMLRRLLASEELR